MAIFTHVSDNFKSARLRDLVKSEKDGGLLPDLDTTIGEFEAVIKWQQVSAAGERVPEPVRGFDVSYDLA